GVAAIAVGELDVARLVRHRAVEVRDGAVVVALLVVVLAAADIGVADPVAARLRRGDHAGAGVGRARAAARADVRGLGRGGGRGGGGGGATGRRGGRGAGGGGEIETMETRPPPPGRDGRRILSRRGGVSNGGGENFLPPRVMPCVEPPHPRGRLCRDMLRRR